MRVFSLFIFIYALSLSSATPPKEVRIGGLFPSFFLDGRSVLGGQRRLAGFLMAVREINANPDILPNTTIKISVKDTKLDIGMNTYIDIHI
jgi:hypothetical protein